ncbi:MAG: hypothetical protein DRP84_09180 [Spirochaetes bacterium]|nr:MAG: hypothetical protein DRP84_09180 [Spirochaetota bacterium]
MAASTEHLSSMAQELQAIVAQFKIDASEQEKIKQKNQNEVEKSETETEVAKDETKEEDEKEDNLSNGKENNVKTEAA